jgi:hypothetical protein
MTYYLLQNDEKRGPYTIGQLRTMWSSGALTSETLYSTKADAKTDGDWLPLEFIIDQLEPPDDNTLTGSGSRLDPDTARGSLGRPAINSIGTLLLVGGLVFAIYYWLFYDTTVTVPSTTLFGERIGGGRVHNIGLMQNRQNGLIISAAVAFAGLFCVLFARFSGRKR